MTEVELERCFEFIRHGEGFVDAEKWVSALASPLVKSAAASVIALARKDRCSDDQQLRVQQDVHFYQQQDLQRAPCQEYWMVKRGAEVKVFELYIIERRRWADPVDVLLRGQEVGGLGVHKSRLFVTPMKQTTNGLMKQWRHLKLANDNNSHDLGFEQLR